MRRASWISRRCANEWCFVFIAEENKDCLVDISATCSDDIAFDARCDKRKDEIGGLSKALAVLTSDKAMVHLQCSVRCGDRDVAEGKA